ncbi:hypothetical protein, variant 1 [Aphanomyces astaci]|uniref:Cytochrome P450 n=1 Tax=Aphanomyces astaci TaxID=112090 RepID=W4HBI0_APHAT|nr:hypothetical protein, variant 1 [Aphanomyces astaci]ETV88926.1 hypothetical protein, variant 1 [Aphanomyces astaci]|eukprot:XP_009821326.1 hypothetical protein, variant 1 [Aphanomyces astaci]
MDVFSNSVAAASAITVMLGVVAWLAFTRTSPRGAPPVVPSWVPFFGSTLSFSKDPVAFLRQCQAKYGSVFSVYLAGKTMTFFVSPKSYSALLKHKSLSHKPAFQDISQKALDQSAAFARYTQALHPDSPVVDYHKLIHPHLQHSSAVGGLIERTLAQQRRVLGQFGASQRLSLLSFVERCIFESGTRVLLGDSLVDANPTLWQAFHTFDQSFPLFVAGVPPLFLPSAANARRSLVHALDANTAADAAAIIQKRLEAVKTTFPAHVVAPYDAAKESMALLWAASANSIPTTFWSLFYLLQNPTAWNAVRDEVRGHLGVGDVWSGDQLGKCVLLASAVDEALRLSASSLMMRVATEDVELKLPDSHVHLAKGSNVMIFPSLGHFDDAIFPQSKSFQVDRFVHATSAQAEAFKPFGMGVTMCPGRNFAKNQVKMFVALVMLETKRVALVPGYVEPVHDPTRLGLGYYDNSNMCNMCGSF